MKIRNYIQASPLFTIHEVNKELQKILAPELKGEAVNFLEAFVLMSIFLEGETPLHPQQLSKGLNCSKSRMGQAISHLEENKWLKRKISDRDARHLTLQLTPQGRSKAIRLTKVFDTMQRAWEKEWGMTQILDLLQKIQKLPRPFFS